MNIFKWLGLSPIKEKNGLTVSTYANIEKHYQSFLDEIEDGYYEVYLNGRFVYFNKYFSRLTGYRPRELQERTLLDILTDESRPQVEETFKKIYLTGLSTDMMEWEIIRRDGVRRTFEASVTTRKPLIGEDILIRGVVRDVTDLKESADAILQAHHSNTINNDGFAIIDPGNDHTILHCNKIFEKITGYTREELLGNKYTILYGPQTDEKTADCVRQALEGQRECQVIIQSYRKDGSMFWSEVAFAPVYDAEDKVTFVINTIHDLTTDIHPEYKPETSVQQHRP